MTSTRSALPVAMLLALVLAGGCTCNRSGLGEDCSDSSDCEDGLVCSPDTNTCQAGTDAAPGTDAANTDAANTDAANTDAAPGTDATPGTDAATGTDAAPTMCVPLGVTCVKGDPTAVPCCGTAMCCCPGPGCGPGTAATCLAICPVG